MVNWLRSRLALLYWQGYVWLWQGLGENPQGKEVAGLLVYLDRIESMVNTVARVKREEKVTEVVSDLGDNFKEFCNFVVHRLKTPQLIEEFMVAAQEFFEQRKKLERG